MLVRWVRVKSLLEFDVTVMTQQMCYPEAACIGSELPVAGGV